MNKEKQKLALSGVERIIPELRFPQFEDAEVWEKKKLEDIFEFKNGINASKEQYGKGVKFINVLDIIQNEFITYDKIIGSVEISEKEISKNEVCYGDILFQRSSETREDAGQANVYLDREEKAVFGGFVIRGQGKSKYEPMFMNYLLKTELVRKEITSKSAGSTRYNIGQDSLNEVVIALPMLTEQQKIANCLSALDNLITAETEKLDHLKDHKKGLLQQIFPANGETKPQFRFPEFEGDGDWEEKCVNDFFEVGSSKRVLQKDWKKEGVPFYRTRELVSLSKNEPFGSDIYISEDLFLELSEKYGTPKSGDFLVSGVGTLGILYQVNENDKFYFKDGNVIWFKLTSAIVSDYFKHCFHTKFFQKQIFGQSSASTVGTYTISNARKTKFWKPIKKEEQQKIANCLSSADALIESQTTKIEALKAHKKGLMQQLFPNVNS